MAYVNAAEAAPLLPSAPAREPTIIRTPKSEEDQDRDYIRREIRRALLGGLSGAELHYLFRNGDEPFSWEMDQ